MEILKDRIKAKMKAKSPSCEVLMFDNTTLTITWPEKGSEIYINGIQIENALTSEVERVQGHLNLKPGNETDYCDPEQNPAIVSDLFQPSEPDEKKSDEIDYTDPNQNPAIPIDQ